MEDSRFGDLGQLLEASRLTAQMHWRDMYAKHIAIDDLLADQLRAVKIACNVHPGGAVDVLVRVHAKNPAFHEVFFWKAQQVAGTYRVL